MLPTKLLKFVAVKDNRQDCLSPFNQIFGRAGRPSHKQKNCVWDGRLARLRYFCNISTEFSCDRPRERNFYVMFYVNFYVKKEAIAELVQRAIARRSI